MKEYIEREALIATLEKIAKEDRNNYFHLDEITQEIFDAPAADVVERKRGRWLSAYEYALKLGVTDKEKLEEAKKDKWWKFCKDCEQQVKGFHNFCPNCGADMREEQT